MILVICFAKVLLVWSDRLLWKRKRKLIRVHVKQPTGFLEEFMIGYVNM